MAGKIDISVVIPIDDPDRIQPIPEVYAAYSQALQQSGYRCEFIYVVNASHSEICQELTGMAEAIEDLRMIQLARWYGEAAALTVGFEHAAGDILMTLPPYIQVEAAGLPQLIDALSGADMAIARRYPRTDSFFNQIQTRLFHIFLKLLLGTTFHDLQCNVRVMKSAILEKVSIYGDQSRFLPILARRFGYRVTEVALPQPRSKMNNVRYPLGVYPRRLLDVLSIFFLVKFTQKPLRFFGVTGLFTFLAGSGFTFYLMIQRLYMGIPLADRPALLLGLLLIVLGVQLLAIGLIGELIIFTHARDLKDYLVEKIVN